MRKHDKINLSVGVIFTGTVRRFLDRMIFEERIAKYHETKGLLTNHFTLIGVDDDVANILFNWVNDKY